MRFNFIILSLVSFLTGCTSSSEMRTALTDMGVTSDSEYGAYGLRLQRSIDVTGLGAEEVVGSITSDVDKWSITEQLARFSPIRNDIPDNMSPRLINGQSFIVERQFKSEPEITMTELIQLNEALTDLQEQLASINDTKVKITIFESVTKILSQNNADAKLIANNLNRLYPDELFDEENLEISLHTRINNLSSAEEIKKDKVTESKNKIQQINNKGGVVVTNWQRKVKADYGVNVSDVNNVQATTNKVLGGYLILAEPRIVTLYIGHDAISNKTTKPAISFKVHRNYLTHFQLRAKKVVYSELQEKILQVSVKANLKNLIDLAEQLNLVSPTQAASLKAEIEITYALASLTSSIGALDATKSCLKIRDFSLADLGTAPRENIIEEIKAAKDTVKVISMRVVLNEQLKIQNSAETLPLKLNTELPYEASDKCSSE